MDQINTYHRLYNSFRNATKPFLYSLTRYASRFIYRRELPCPPHKARAGIAMKGLNSGLITANPLFDESPHFLLGYFERHVTRVMRDTARAGGVFYDIGANIGYHSLQASRLVGREGWVHCFEPGPIEYDLLSWNIVVNELVNVKAHRVAVSDRSGIEEFAVFSSPGVNHLIRENTPDDARVIEVRTVTLDEFVYLQGNPEPNLIKIDVEGAELGVLQGASNLLRDRRPVVVCEVWNSSREQVTSYMSKHNYDFQNIHRDGWSSDIVFFYK